MWSCWELCIFICFPIHFTWKLDAKLMTWQCCSFFPKVICRSKDVCRADHLLEFCSLSQTVTFDLMDRTDLLLLHSHIILYLLIVCGYHFAAHITYLSIPCFGIPHGIGILTFVKYWRWMACFQILRAYNRFDLCLESFGRRAPYWLQTLCCQAYRWHCVATTMANTIVISYVGLLPSKFSSTCVFIHVLGYQVIYKIA